jgi:hypothetical protein
VQELGTNVAAVADERGAPAPDAGAISLGKCLLLDAQKQKAGCAAAAALAGPVALAGAIEGECHQMSEGHSGRRRCAMIPVHRSGSSFCSRGGQQRQWQLSASAST